MADNRGRPRKTDEEKILENGFTAEQWERLQAEAKAKGYAETQPYLRAIVNDHFAREDATEASAQTYAELRKQKTVKKK